MQKQLALILFHLVMLCSCAAHEELGIQPDPIELSIADGIGRIAGVYEQLALISSATTNDELAGQSYNYQEDTLPDIWLRELTLIEDYNGDVEVFVRMLSAMGGMPEPRIDAGQRGKPILVSVKKGTRKLISYLADVGYQSGDRAMIQPDVGLGQVIVSF